MKQYLGNGYEQEQGSLRTDMTEEGTKKMDCSEFMCRYLKQVCGLDNVPTYTTTTMIDLLEDDDDNLEYIQNSSESDFVDIKTGDIFLWRTERGGHTGVVVSFNSTTDQVTVMEAIGNSGAAEESLSKNLDEYCKGCVRTSIYSRKGKALGGHTGWKGYFRPKIK